MKLFILILIFSYFNIFTQQDCGVNPPKQINDCFQREEYGEYHCCYITEVSNPTNSLCKLIDNKIYENLVIEVNGKLYNSFCLENIQIQNENEKLIGTDCCYVKDPEPEHCFACSTNINSCCYYQNLNDNSTKCFWLGYFYDEIHEFANVTNSNVIVNCGAEYYNVFIVLIFLFLM